MWAGSEQQREQIGRAGLELAPGELLAAATAARAELEGITAVLLLTDEDDFNALASADLAGSVDGPVYQLAPRSPSHGMVAPYTGGETLFSASLTGYDVGRRCAGGAPIFTQPADGGIPAGADLLFLVRTNGALAPVTPTSTPGTQGGGHHDPARPRTRGFVMLPARVPPQRPAGLTEAQACGRQCPGGGRQGRG